MKGLPEQYRNLLSVCLHLLLLTSTGVQSAALTAEQLISEKVDDLNRFVETVEANSRNCGVLNGCSADVCSRLSCYQYGTPRDPAYRCLEVQNNTACGPYCTQRNFDFSRSYLRRVDEVDDRISRTVCTHRNLDDKFKTSTISDSTHFFRAFFGSVDGTFRIYPGADEADCTAATYDPRKRPWYIESTSVPKAVTIVVDSGLNMRSKLSGGTTQETYGSKGSATALAVLDTLKEDEDYVTLITFDADGSKLLNTTMIYNKALLYRSFSIMLPQNVAGGSKMNTNASATSDAINSAITALSTPTSPVPANYLKVVVVLTTGEQFQNLSQMNISSNTGVNTFVYNFLAAAPQCSASTRISIESIAVSKVDNPLYALQSLYTFLASVHKSYVGDGVDYGNMYADYSGIDNSTLTLSKAAFGSSGELLGVLGIDFYEEKVNEQYLTLQFQSIVDTARSHQPQTPFDATKNLNTSVCLNITDACPSLADTYVDRFLCVKKSDDKNIGCCGKCIPKKNKVPAILEGTFGGVGGLLVILLLFYCCCRRKAKAVISCCCRREAKPVKPTKDDDYKAHDDMDGYKAPGSVSET